MRRYDQSMGRIARGLTLVAAVTGGPVGCDSTANDREALDGAHDQGHAEDRGSTLEVSSINALRSALDAASPGDTIYIADGTYADVSLTIRATGTKEQRVNVRAKHPGRVIFTGDTSVVIRADHVAVSGIVFEDVRKTADSANRSVVIIDGTTGVFLQHNHFLRSGRTDSPYTPIVTFKNGATKNYLQFNRFERSLSISVTVSDSGFNPHNRIQHNHFLDIAYVGSVHPGQTNGMEAVQLGTGAAKTSRLESRVRYNLFENCIGDAAEVISVKTSSNEIYGNSFVNSAPMTLRAGSDNAVYDNVFIMDRDHERTRGGLRIYGRGHRVTGNYFESMRGFALWLDAGYDDSHEKAEGVLIESNDIFNAVDDSLRYGRSGFPNQPYDIMTRFNEVRQDDRGTALSRRGGSSLHFVDNRFDLGPAVDRGYDPQNEDKIRYEAVDIHPGDYEPLDEDAAGPQWM